jgi:hypothetical protein
VDVRDVRPQGDPETVVCLSTSTLIGLNIIGSGFGDVLLGVREDMDGQPVTCVIGRHGFEVDV